MPWGLPDGLELVEDVSPAHWIVEGVDGSSWKSRPLILHALMPATFEAYSRILHPAWLFMDGGPEWRQVSWREVALSKNRELHRTSTFEDVANIPSDARGRGLPSNEPTPQIVEALVPVLEQNTTTPDLCWFGIWGGYGGLPYDSSDYPGFDIPNRGYTLFRGRVRDVTDFYFAWGKKKSPSWCPPNIWWPDDHAWCVASDIDHYETYVGATTPCVQEILRHPELESLPAMIHDSIDRGPSPAGSGD